MSKSIRTSSTYDAMFRDYPDVVDIKDICRMLGIGKNKAYSLVKADEIKAIPCSKKIKVPKIAVIDYLLRNI